MASGIYFSTRTEEEKTKDILMYEKKAKASAICEKYEKVKKRASLATFISAVVCTCAAAPLFYRAYDKESFVGMILTVASAVLITICVRVTVGTLISHSLPVYLKWGSLSQKWKAARAVMHEYEAKFAEQTVFEADMKKAEEKLMAISEELISFAESKGIETEQ
ncbi:MAG: hypothetical protein IJF69_04825 [Clostridia bacterium]|nr:hypothetical protein [Clostridia bacterium]